MLPEVCRVSLVSGIGEAADQWLARGASERCEEKIL